MKYRVIVQTGPGGFDEYKVISHSLKENCLVLILGTLNCGAKEEQIIPISSFVHAWSEDLDKEV